MNRFHVAVLRILVKRRAPIQLSSLVDGFPDSAEDDVLAAISDLKSRGLITIPEFNLHSLVSISRSRRREVLEIVGWSDGEKIEAPVPASNQFWKGASRFTPGNRYESNPLSSRTMRIFAISSMLALCLISWVGQSLPTLGPERASVSHPNGPSVQVISGDPEVRVIHLASGHGGQHSFETLVFIQQCHGHSHETLRE